MPPYSSAMRRISSLLSTELPTLDLLLQAGASLLELTNASDAVLVTGVCSVCEQEARALVLRGVAVDVPRAVDSEGVAVGAAVVKVQVQLGGEAETSQHPRQSLGRI
jgi:hypothetical protein